MPAISGIKEQAGEEDGRWGVRREGGEQTDRRCVASPLGSVDHTLMIDDISGRAASYARGRTDGRDHLKSCTRLLFEEEMFLEERLDSEEKRHAGALSSARRSSQM